MEYETIIYPVSNEHIENLTVKKTPKTTTCSANQMTGFYMMPPLAFNGLISLKSFTFGFYFRNVT